MIPIDTNRGSRISLLGGQDGLVNVVGVILGVAAATQDTRIIIAAGLAATFAESISMGAVAYTSTLANDDLYLSEREREYRHIHLAPEVEIQEIRDSPLPRSKPFSRVRLCPCLRTAAA